MTMMMTTMTADMTMTMMTATARVPAMVGAD
jgi:hypothetical protein